MPAGGTEAGTRPAELDIQRWTSGGSTRRSAGSQAGTGRGPRGRWPVSLGFQGRSWKGGATNHHQDGRRPRATGTAVARMSDSGPSARLPAGDTVPSPWADVTLPQTGPGEGTETPGSDRGLRAELELPTLVPTLILPPSALHPGDAQLPRAERGARLTWVLGLGQRVVRGWASGPPPFTLKPGSADLHAAPPPHAPSGKRRGPRLRGKRRWPHARGRGSLAPCPPRPRGLRKVIRPPQATAAR